MANNSAFLIINTELPCLKLGFPLMKYLLDKRDVFGRWVVDDSKSVLQGDNEAFPVQNNNKKGEKFRYNLSTGG